MNKVEAERLAASIHALRPDWPTRSLFTLIAKKLMIYGWRDAVLALSFVATDPDSRTPARVLEDGPWWDATRIANAEPTRLPPPIAEVLGRQRWPEPPSDDYLAARADLKAGA